MKTPVLTLLVLICLTTTSAAWDELGHMTAASVAYDQLTPDVRKKVVKLLKINPKYTTWVAGVAAKDKDRTAFLRASIWADDIKKDPTYIQDGTHNGNRPSGSNAGRNIGYGDKLRHKYWHFIDMPFSPDATPLVDPPVPNAKTQIALFRKTLKSTTASNNVKSYDLVWLLHLVADVHQPLHATSRFNNVQTEGDDGANGVTVCWNPCTSKGKLHAFWDDILGTSKKPKDAIAKAKELPPADPQLALIDDEGKWTQESFEAAQAQVYVSPIGVGPGPYVLDDAYKAAAQEIARQRLALAGVRLANLLNDALK